MHELGPQQVSIFFRYSSLTIKYFSSFLRLMRVPLRLIILLACTYCQNYHVFLVTAAGPYFPIGWRNVYASINLIIGQSLLWTPAASVPTFTIWQLRYCSLHISFREQKTQIKACRQKKVPRLSLVVGMVGGVCVGVREWLWLCESRTGFTLCTRTCKSISGSTEPGILKNWKDKKRHVIFPLRE